MDVRKFKNALRDRYIRFEPWYDHTMPECCKRSTLLYTGDRMDLVENKTYWIYDSFEEMVNKSDLNLKDVLLKNAAECLESVGLNVTDYPCVKVANYCVDWYLIVGNDVVYSVESEEDFQVCNTIVDYSCLDCRQDCIVLEKFCLDLF